MFVFCFVFLLSILCFVIVYCFLLFCVLFLLLCRLFPIFVQVYLPLPPGGNPIVVNIIYHIISYHTTTVFIQKISFMFQAQLTNIGLS
jgi:hypothetical protein